jgi:dynein light intermediate chain 2
MKAAHRGDLWSFLVEQGKKAAAAGPTAPAPAATAAAAAEDGAAPPSVTTTLPPRGRETFVLFVGDKGAGKSTLRLHFLNPTKEIDARPKPTVGLDYQFGRRTNPETNAKDVAHMWELAGGTAAARAAELTAVPLSHPGRLAPGCAVVVLVLDLSRPADLLPSLRKWCGAAAVALASATAANGGGGGGGGSAAAGRRGSSGSRASSPVPDDEGGASASAVAAAAAGGAAGRRFPVPLLLVGAKADSLAREDGPKRKLVQQALRFGAHAYGASLVCTGTDKAGKESLKAYRLALSAAVFGTAAGRRATGVDDKTASKPLCVPAGCDADSVEKIGLPRGVRSADEFELMARDAQLDAWQRAVCEFYAPSEGKEGEEEEEDEGKNGGSGGVETMGDDAGGGGGGGGGGGQFDEPAIDAARARRDELLVAYKREAEKRAKVAAQDARGAERAKSRSSKSSSSSKSSAGEGGGERRRTKKSSSAVDGESGAPREKPKTRRVKKSSAAEETKE